MSYVAGLKQGGHHYLAAGLGSYGYEPQVDYAFGIPRSIHGGGAAMNIPIVNIYGYDGDGTDTAKQNRLNYVLQVGTLSSALEHAVPEQMFVTEENPGEAISAVKALSKASAAGQRIYRITQANQASVLSNIHHGDLVMNEIRNALNTGKEVITHTDSVSVPGWSGAGYIIYDPVTGDGAYKIGGGENGAFYAGFSLGMSLGIMFAAAIAGSEGSAALAGPAGLVATLLIVIQIALPAYLIQVEAYGDNPDAMDCLHKGIALGLIVGSGGLALGAVAFGGAAASPLLAAVLAEMASMAVTGTFENLGNCAGF